MVLPNVLSKDKEHATSGSATNIRSELRSIEVLKGSSEDSNVEDLPDTPQDAFKVWLDEAINAAVKEPHAMTLSTVDEQGWPDARVLILKDVDYRGWHFSIKSKSPKGIQVANNHHVALTFYWREMGRQIRLRGSAIRLSDAECQQDFAQRPMTSKISAFASKQSEVMANREELTQAISKAKSKMEGGSDEISLDWSVYAVLPDFIEFWQGSRDRFHHRLQYARSEDGDGWKKQLLWP